MAENSCKECNGESVQFKSKGRDLQCRICSRWESPGHLSRDDISKQIKERRLAEMSIAFPSGRQA